jgi:hypothetical protein
MKPDGLISLEVLVKIETKDYGKVTHKFRMSDIDKDVGNFFERVKCVELYYKKLNDKQNS